MERDRSFGRLLQQLRKRRDLTQEALAQQAFCAVDTIKKIEAGVRRPSRQLAEQFANVLVLAEDERATFLSLARARGTGERAAEQPTRPRRIKLPHQPALFVGRQAELATLHELFAAPNTRLVSIVGPGGMGKSRLAVAFAAQLVEGERFVDGLYFVPLAPLDDAGRFVPALAEALELALDAARQRARSPQQQLFDHLRHKQLLLILDNVEHLLAAPHAEGGLSVAVAALLAAAPGVAVLATSRQRLNVRDEQLLVLGGLEAPGEDNLAGNSAVELFVQRARRLRPDFARAVTAPDPATKPEINPELHEVARICRLVEGMPLALELAAGWVDTLSLAEIAAQIERGLDVLATDLRDLPARHRSLRALFDGSYNRLSAQGQALFAGFAAFRGGATLAAVQAVAGATQALLLPQLQRLIAASLLSHDAQQGRYTLHELLRQYALEKLVAEAGAEEQARDRHAGYFASFVQEQGHALRSAEQQAALAALDADRDNLRAAWLWAAQRGRVDLLLRAIEGLGYFCEWRCYWAEGEQLFELAAAQLAGSEVDSTTQRMLILLRAWQANFRRLQGDVIGAEQRLQQSLTLLDGAPAETDLRAERAFVLLQCGLVASEGRLVDARNDFEQSLALYQQLERAWEMSHVYLWLGDLARYQAAYEEARRYFHASLAIRSQLGDQRGVAEVLIWDSHAAAETGYLAEAEALARRSHALHEHLQDPANRAFGLGELGVMLMWSGKYAEAFGVLQQSLALYQELGNGTMAVYAQGWLAVAHLTLGHYAEASGLSRQMLHAARGLAGVQSGLAFMLHYAGWVALATGELHEAAQLLQESVELHRQTGNRGQIGTPLAQLGYTHWLLGDAAAAQEELRQVLQRCLPHHIFLPLLLALPVIALMLAEHGESERAAELYALAWRYPFLANAQSFIDSFGKQLDAVVATLPPQVAAAAQARGEALDFWQTCAGLEHEIVALLGTH